MCLPSARRPLLLTLTLTMLAACLFASPDSVAAKGKGAPVANKGAPANPSLSALNKGIAALEAKDLPTAARLLTEAYRASPRNEILYHLGRLALAEGRGPEAHDFYRRYLADPARDTDEAATQDAEKLIAQPAPPGGTVSVQSSPGAFVLVDQRVVGTLPLLLPLFLSPGEHTVTLEFPDKKLEAPVQVAPGRLTELRLSRNSGAVVVSVIPAILLYAEPQGTNSAETRLLLDVTEQAARGEQYTMLPAELAVGQAAELKECLKQESCQRQLAVKNKSGFVFRQHIKKSGDEKKPNWDIDMQLLGVDVEQPAATATASCAGCTLDAAATKLKEVVGKLLAEGLLRPRGTLQISTEPASATLRLDDGTPVQTPFSATLWKGTYELRITLPGYKTEQRTVEVLDGKPVELRVELSKDGPLVVETPPEIKPKTRAPRPRWRLALGGIMIGAGVAMAAVGAVGVLKNEKCANPTGVLGDTCSKVYATGLPGGFALGSGVLLIGSGALLIGLPEPLK